jgi:glycosyltransferase involved in cell wall biosynthesis
VTAAGGAAARPRLLAFSHLRWQDVRQRPQHLMTRLARWWSVLFVEEPMPAATTWLSSREVAPGVEVLVPHTTGAPGAFDAAQAAELRRLLQPHLTRQAIDVCWFFTPMAWPLIDGLDPACVVFDCMDDLAAHAGAPRHVLRQRESQLLRRADLVLASGPALYDAQRRRHPNAYCVPNSVDAAHFAPASLQPDAPDARAAQALHERIAPPRLGYFGVIDDRIDLALIDRVAQAHPDWSLVMVGPLARVDAALLPKRPNLHWLGAQPYAVLPHLLAGWDLALLPFARNEATRSVSPAKTLEYLAGEKPVVSTAIPDVIGLYGHAIEVVQGGAGEFVEVCERVLNEGPRERDQRLHVTLATVATQSWDHSASTVRDLLLAARSRRPPPVPAPVSPPALAPFSPLTLAVTR